MSEDEKSDYEAMLQGMVSSLTELVMKREAEIKRLKAGIQKLQEQNYCTLCGALLSDG